MTPFPIKNFCFGLGGALVGGIIGGFVCQLIWDNFGAYAVAIPGAMVGLGFSLAARRRHIAFAITCGILGLLAGLLTQWLVYSDNETFLSLLIELKDYTAITFIMLGLGAICGFSIGHGRDHFPSGPQHSN
jgi:hypothetical protein